MVCVVCLLGEVLYACKVVCPDSGCVLVSDHCHRHLVFTLILYQAVVCCLVRSRAEFLHSLIKHNGAVTSMQAMELSHHIAVQYVTKKGCKMPSA